MSKILRDCKKLDSGFPKRFQELHGQNCTTQGFEVNTIGSRLPTTA